MLQFPIGRSALGVEPCGSGIESTAANAAGLGHSVLSDAGLGTAALTDDKQRQAVIVEAQEFVNLTTD